MPVTDSEVAELLGNKSEAESTVETEKTGSSTATESSTDKTYTINGRTYTSAQVEDMAKDYAELEKEKGRLASEVGKLKITQPLQPKQDSAQQLTSEQKKQLLQVFKDELGVVTRDELKQENYAKDANAEIAKIATRYGAKPEEVGKELLELGVQLPVEKFDTFYKVNHPDKYENWRKEQVAQNKPTTPYTEVPTKQGIELPSGESRLTFNSKNRVEKALELIGHD